MHLWKVLFQELDFTPNLFLGLTYRNFTFSSERHRCLRGKNPLTWLATFSVKSLIFLENVPCVCWNSLRLEGLAQSPSLCVVGSPGFIRVLLKHEYNINNILSSSFELISNKGKNLSYTARWNKKVLNFKWMKGIAFPHNVLLINGTCYHVVSTETRNSIIFVNEKSFLGIKANLHTKIRLG